MLCHIRRSFANTSPKGIFVYVCILVLNIPRFKLLSNSVKEIAFDFPSYFFLVSISNISSCYIGILRVHQIIFYPILNGFYIYKNWACFDGFLDISSNLLYKSIVVTISFNFNKGC